MAKEILKRVEKEGELVPLLEALSSPGALKVLKYLQTEAGRSRLTKIKEVEKFLKRCEFEPEDTRRLIQSLCQAGLVQEVINTPEPTIVLVANPLFFLEDLPEESDKFETIPPEEFKLFQEDYCDFDDYMPFSELNANDYLRRYSVLERKGGE